MSNRADAADADEARQKEFVPKGSLLRMIPWVQLEEGCNCHLIRWGAISDHYESDDRLCPSRPYFFITGDSRNVYSIVFHDMGISWIVSSSVYE